MQRRRKLHQEARTTVRAPQRPRSTIQRNHQAEDVRAEVRLHNVPPEDRRERF